MGKTGTPKTNPARFIYTALLSVAGALFAVLAVGTIAGFARKSDTPLITLGKAEAQPRQTLAPDGDVRIFSGLGRLRIPLADSSVLTLSIAFPYQASDIAFTEELAVKIGDFKTIAADYFSSLPPDEVIQIDEEAAKAEILNRYNASLRLGRISALYFNDMMILKAR